MNKILLGVLLGAVLGAIDGATAWFTPEVRPAIVGIIIGGAIKSIIVGAICGAFARKVHSVGAGVLLGLVIGRGAGVYRGAIAARALFGNHCAGDDCRNHSWICNAAIWRCVERGGCELSGIRDRIGGLAGLEAVFGDAEAGHF